MFRGFCGTFLATFSALPLVSSFFAHPPWVFHLSSSKRVRPKEVGFMVEASRCSVSVHWKVEAEPKTSMVKMENILKSQKSNANQTTLEEIRNM